MTLPLETVNNLAYSFFSNYLEDESKELPLSVLKILDFDYNFEKGELTYEGCSPSLVFKKEEWETQWRSGKNKEKASEYNYKITPYTFKPFDIECIETALNSNKVESWRASAILDSLGWVPRLESDNSYRLHMVGGATYDIWKEPDISWDYDLEEDATDWKSGEGWNDGWNLDKDIPKDWLEDFRG